MVIDGKPGLACHTSLEAGEHTFEPLGDLPIIKDLMVDRAPFAQKFTESRVAKETVNPITRADDLDYNLYWDTFERLNYCRECMCCYDVCPALTERGDWDFIGPGAMMQIAYRALDPHDEGDRVRQAVFSGLWRCDLCGKCSTVCVAQIDHVGLLSQLQAMAEEAGLKPTDPAAFPSEPLVASDETSAAPTTGSFDGTEPSEIVSNYCSDCHDGNELLEFKTDTAEAEARIKHAENAAPLTEEQKQALVDLWTS